MTKTLIIDDEPLARRLLKELLKTYPEIEVVAECGDGFEGLKAIQEIHPDLIFLDIQMPKITGFELMELLNEPPVVIFTTAYDEYALKAFEVNALDYLLKPISKDRLEKALEKVYQFTPQKIRTFIEETGHSLITEQIRRIVVKDNSHIKIIPIDEVYYLEAAEDYVRIHTPEKYFLKHTTMANLERQLPEKEFVRIHRSYLVNVNHITKVEPYEKDQYCVILRTQKQLLVSRSGYVKLKKNLGI